MTRINQKICEHYGAPYDLAGVTVGDFVEVLPFIEYLYCDEYDPHGLYVPRRMGEVLPGMILEVDDINVTSEDHNPIVRCSGTDNNGYEFSWWFSGWECKPATQTVFCTDGFEGFV